MVAFISSMHSDTYRPFLIISTAASLHSWEGEFYQLDPSIDVVMYSGNKEIRNSIRRLEFYDGGGCILFQVLILVPEILIEVCSRSWLLILEFLNVIFGQRLALTTGWGLDELSHLLIWIYVLLTYFVCFIFLT